MRLCLVALLSLESSCMEAVMGGENSRSLDFYGVVVDQSGSPVSNVLVTAKVGTYEGFSSGGGEDYTTKTDRNGRFSFTGIRGAGVGFLLELKGYEYNQRLPSSTRPSDYVPDPSKPVIFRMWKLQGPVPMLDTRMTVGIPCDGTPVSFDLATGRKGGDLVVSLVRNPLHIDRKNRFDWTLTIAIRNGGLIAVTDPYPNEAPANGYAPSISVTEKATDEAWNREFSNSYYFQGNNGGSYGLIDIDVYTDFEPPPTALGVEIFMNPSGSRNLESDPNHRLN
jgi:hypothetical protein